jgi:hypothetical protein
MVQRESPFVYTRGIPQTMDVAQHNCGVVLSGNHSVRDPLQHMYLLRVSARGALVQRAAANFTVMGVRALKSKAFAVTGRGRKN